MSDKVTYILEVLDKYSVNTRKFRKELLGIKKSAETVGKCLVKTNLSFKALAANANFTKTIRQANALARSLDKVRMSSKSIGVGKGVNAMGGSMAMMNANMRNMMFLNHRMMSKIQRGQERVIRQTKSMGQGSDGVGRVNRGRSPMMAGGGNLSTLRGMGKAMGYYALIDKAIRIPGMIHETAIEMDGLRASLAAMIPRAKNLKGATAESEIRYLRGVGEKFGLKFRDISEPYMKMLGTGADAQTVKGITESITALGRLAGLKSPALVDTLRGMEQMLTKRKIQGQEFNLQMQQLPMAKGLFFDAFYNLSQKYKMKDVTEENASAKFYEYMSKGMMTSEPILKEVTRLANERFGEDFIKKSHVLAGEEARLSNAFHKLGTHIADILMPTMKSTALGLTSFVESIDGFLTDTETVAGWVRDKKEENARSVMGKAILSGSANRYAFPPVPSNDSYKADYTPMQSNPQPEQKIVLEILGTNIPDNMTLIPSGNSENVSMSIKRGQTLSPIGGY